VQRLVLVTRLFEWRWAPCVGLVLGSLAFVVLAIALIPDRLGAASDEPEEPEVALGESPHQPASVDTEAPSVARRRSKAASRAPSPTAAPAPQAPPTTADVQSFFQAPAMELPPPLEEPEPPAPPPAAPTATEISVPIVPTPPPENPPPPAVAEPAPPPAE